MTIRKKASGPVTLGERYRDQLTGVEGVATSRSEYLYGCVRVGLEYRKGEGSEIEFFDEQRLVTAIDRQPVKTTARTGGPRPTPPARDAHR